MKDDRIAALLEPVLVSYALDLEEVDVRPAGKRRVVRVVVDGDGPDGRGPLLDDIAEATRAISAALDDDDTLGTAPYTLEVSSRGVSRPLTLPRHWRRNRGRLVRLTLAPPSSPSEELTGRVRAADQTTVTLDVDGTGRVLPLAEITLALVQVELNRRPDPDELDRDEHDRDEHDRDELDRDELDRDEPDGKDATGDTDLGDEDEEED